MYELIFTKNSDCLFNETLHKHLNAAKQIIIELNLPAYIIDNNTGEIVFEYTTK